MKLIFVRHGDPDYSVDSLTEKGWREAELLSDRLAGLPVTEYFCSPLGRAKDTAKPTFAKNHREAVICDWLEEFTGYILDPEGGQRRIPWDLMPSYWTKNPELYDKDAWIKTPVMQSGTVEETYLWATGKLDDLLAEHGYVRDGNLYRVDRSNSDTLLFFCHFGIECVLLSHLLGLSPLVLWQGFVALPSSVTTLITEEREQGIGYFRCNGFGDISHLYAADEPPSFAARFCERYENEDERH